MKKLLLILLILIAVNTYSQTRDTKTIGITRTIVLSGHSIREMYTGLTNTKLIKLDSSVIVSGSEIGSSGFYTFTVTSPGWYRLYVNNTLKPEYGVVQAGRFIDSLGTTNMGAVLNMATQKITNLGTPSSTNDAATKGYVDGVIGGGGLDTTTVLFNNRADTVTSPYWFKFGTTKFGTGLTSAILDFSTVNDGDEAILFKKNGANILEFDDDTNVWDFKFPITVNGTALQSLDTTKVAFRDRSLSVTGNWLFPQTTRFGNGTQAVLNFSFDNLDNGLLFKQNGTDLLEFNGEDQFWDFKYPITVADITATDDVTISGSLSANDITSATTIDATGDISTLADVIAQDITATTSITSPDAHVTDDLTVDDDATVTGTLTVGDINSGSINSTGTIGATTSLETLGDLVVGDDATISDTLTVGTVVATNLTRGMMYFTSNVLASPADATTYYYGGNTVLAPGVNAVQRAIYFPHACTIKAVVIMSYQGTGGSTESVSYYVRKNNTTDYTVSTSAKQNTTAGFNTASNTSMTIPISAGDYIEFKIVTPTWVTNPVNLYMSATIYFE